MAKVRSQLKGSGVCVSQQGLLDKNDSWGMKVKVAINNGYDDGHLIIRDLRPMGSTNALENNETCLSTTHAPEAKFAFANYQDYGYGIFLLDDKSRDYVLKNIQNEKDPFLRAMMWGSLWDSVREGELDPREYVELAIANLSVERDESIASSVLGRVTMAVNYYLVDADRVAVTHRLEDLLTGEMRRAPSLGRRITFYRGFLNIGASTRAREIYKQILRDRFWPKPMPIGGGIVVGTSNEIPLKTKDRFDIVTRLLILGDPDAPKLLAEREKPKQATRQSVTPMRQEPALQQLRTRPNTGTIL